MAGNMGDGYFYPLSPSSDDPSSRDGQQESATAVMDSISYVPPAATYHEEHERPPLPIYNVTGTNIPPSENISEKTLKLGGFFEVNVGPFQLLVDGAFEGPETEFPVRNQHCTYDTWELQDYTHNPSFTTTVTCTTKQLRKKRSLPPSSIVRMQGTTLSMVACVAPTTTVDGERLPYMCIVPRAMVLEFARFLKRFAKLYVARDSCGAKEAGLPELRGKHFNAGLNSSSFVGRTEPLLICTEVFDSSLHVGTFPGNENIHGRGKRVYYSSVVFFENRALAICVVADEYFGTEALHDSSVPSMECQCTVHAFQYSVRDNLGFLNHLLGFFPLDEALRNRTLGSKWEIRIPGAEELVLAFCMGAQARLGARSLVKWLDGLLMEMIGRYAGVRRIGTFAEDIKPEFYSRVVASQSTS